MYINEIELCNFRIYKGVNRICLTPKNEKNIVIVSGQNGFGKTTFLMSLVWCLYGKNMGQVDSIYKKEIEEKGNYTRYMSDSLNRNAATNGEYAFYVKISFSGVNVENVICDVSIKRSYNTFNGDEKIEVLLDGYAQELIESLSQENQRGEEIFIRDYILPIAIAKFFFFDAEKITALAENNNLREQRKQLSQAYSEVLGIQKYEMLKDTLEEKQDDYRKKSAQVSDEQDLNQLETNVKNTELAILAKENEIQNIDEEVAQRKLASEEISVKLVRFGDKMTLDELSQLKEEKDNLEQRKKDLQNELKESFNYIPFALAGETLANISEQVEDERLLSEQKFKQEDIKEKIEKIKQDIEDEKANLDFSVNIKTADFYTQQIVKLIKKYFCSDVKIVDENLKPLHDFSANQNNELQQLISSIKNDFRYKFEKLNTEFSKTKNQIASIGRKIRDAEQNAQDSHIKDLRDKKEHLDSLINDKTQQIGALKQEIEGLKENLKKYRQEQALLRKKIDDSIPYSAKAGKTKQVIDELAEFITKFKKQKKESLQVKMLESLTQLMHKKAFVKRIDVDIMSSEDIDIILYDANNNIIDKSSLSMGERQLYASALLSSLVSESEIDFPVFIDSPMQKFDKQHAENIIRYFYPNVSKQVVLYPLLYKELTEDEYRLLQPNVCRTYLIKNTAIDCSEFVETDPSNLFTTYNQIDNANQY